ncbi:MAG: hypothetical protein LBB81_04575, partial [Treponema sp.]|nr:hypothetical protein [Treponema sp.]
MKKLFLFFRKIYNFAINRINPAQARIIWLMVHLIVPLLLLFSIFFIGPVRINTQLLDMLPKPNQSREVMKADAVLGEKNSREALILAAADDFQIAKDGAVMLYNTFLNTDEYEKLSFYFDTDLMSEFTDYIYRSRYTIASDKTLDLLKNGGAVEIAQDALA